jgi:hypothetical protein
MGSVGIIRFNSEQRTKIRKHLLVLKGHLLPFSLCNALITILRIVLSIFSYLLHDNIEIYMDTPLPMGIHFRNP